MRALAPGVRQLRGLPPNTINVYLVRDVLVDAGTPAARKRILRELRDVAVVTHARPLRLQPRRLRGARPPPVDGRARRRGDRDRDARPVGHGDRARAREGQDGARAPRHAAAARRRRGHRLSGARRARPLTGHIALWRGEDRMLVAGDVFFNLPRLGAPPDFLTVDPERNRASMRRLAALRPALVLFGHGPPLRDPDRLARAAEKS
jgi:hydroxyacylglutathione hydrolase